MRGGTGKLIPVDAICGNCRFWKDSWFCARHAPVINPQGETAWPTTYAGQGCGDWQGAVGCGDPSCKDPNCNYGQEAVTTSADGMCRHGTNLLRPCSQCQEEGR